ncbi:MAG: L,D-transpeptidase family protein [Lachnospiraceae bacterium]|nr:L,D-transpeptidase family protein [Lachnospiraceae bacterium]
MKKRICIVLALVTVLLAVTGAAGYEMGYRYDPALETLVIVSDRTEPVSYMLSLSEGDRTVNYDIDALIHYYPAPSSIYPLYDSSATKISISVNDEQLDTAVEDFIAAKERESFVAAHITEDCRFFPTKQGTFTDLARMKSSIAASFPSRVSFNAADYYVVEPDPKAAELEALYKRMENCTITYSNGRSISLNDLYPEYSASDNFVSYDREFLKVLVSEIANSYDDAGKKSISFEGVSGNFTVSGGTWGIIADTKAEVERMTDHFDHLRRGEKNRLPEMRQYLSWNFPDRYIEVDKQKQHLYLVSGNEIVMESDCVTGRPKNHTTPSGIFFISEKAVNKTLRGEGYASFVNRWMRLNNDGVGLHDATWRGRFGGEIYLSNGSHGCINLPKAFAYELYKYVVGLKEDEIVVFVH